MLGVFRKRDVEICEDGTVGRCEGSMSRVGSVSSSKLRMPKHKRQYINSIVNVNKHVNINVNKCPLVPLVPLVLLVLFVPLTNPNVNPKWMEEDETNKEITYT